MNAREMRIFLLYFFFRAKQQERREEKRKINDSKPNGTIGRSMSGRFSIDYNHSRSSNSDKEKKKLPSFAACGNWQAANSNNNNDISSQHEKKEKQQQRGHRYTVPPSIFRGEEGENQQ